VRSAHSVDKVVKLSYYSKLAELLELVTRRCSSKLLFPLAHSLAIDCSLNDEVDDMACTAYAVISRDVDVWVEIEAVDKLAVIA